MSIKKIMKSGYSPEAIGLPGFCPESPVKFILKIL